MLKDTKRSVVLRDVAHKAGVSVAAVSMALADHPGISSATKQRVRSVCQELGYRGPRRRPSRRLRPAAGSSAARFGFMLVGSALHEESAESGWQALASASQSIGNRLEVSAIEDAGDHDLVVSRTLELAREVDGLILSGFVDPPLLQRLESARVPCVVCGPIMVDPAAPPAQIGHAVMPDCTAMGRFA